jgi:putative DNA primase/helicase
LKSEAIGILAWMVKGFQDWQRDGLNPPVEVQDATAEYQEDSDPLSDFINERCELRSGLSASTKELYEAYCDYCGKEKPITKNSFGRVLTGKGFRNVQLGSRRTRHWSGIALRDNCEIDYPSPDQDENDSATCESLNGFLIDEDIDLRLD